LIIKTPVSLTEEQKKLLKRFEEIEIDKSSKIPNIIDKFKDAFTGSSH